MNLEITKANNFFKIKGALKRNNIHLFKKEFENIFESANTITLSIEDLISIDSHGVNAISQLHSEAILRNKSLSIIGAGHSSLYTHFKNQAAA